jgi:1-acyl-sn-glycerol-3-phosphate acyltransferase
MDGTQSTTAERSFPVTLPGEKGEPLPYRVLRVIARAITRLTMVPQYVGLEHIPEEPPYLLVTNHLSLFDLPLLLSIIPHTIRAFAANEHRWNPIYWPFLKAGGSIWVRRGEVDRRALREALEVLERGEVLGLAPEGTRSGEAHALQKGKAGAAYLATRAELPILPIGIAGTENVKRRLPRLRRTPVQLVIGQPFCLPKNGRVRSQTLHQFVDLIMCRIAELLPEEYRGVYADQVKSDSDSSAQTRVRS